MTIAGEPSLEEVIDRFVTVWEGIGKHFFERSAEFDLSPPLAKALHALSQPLSMGELADRLYCDASNITGIVDRLESRGLVDRQPDPTDRRVKRLVLTDAGRALWQAHHDRVFDGMPFFAELSGPERRTFHDLLVRMTDGQEEVHRQTA